MMEFLIKMGLAAIGLTFAIQCFVWLIGPVILVINGIANFFKGKD